MGFVIKVHKYLSFLATRIYFIFNSAANLIRAIYSENTTVSILFTLVDEAANGEVQRRQVTLNSYRQAPFRPLQRIVGLLCYMTLTG